MIEVAWDRGTPDIFEEYFGNSINPARGKPTNSEFLMAIKELFFLGKI